MSCVYFSRHGAFAGEVVGEDRQKVQNASLMLPGAGDELQSIKRGLLEFADAIAINKADGPTRTAAELAAQQYRETVRVLGGRRNSPVVFTCSALHEEGIDRIWEALADRHARLIGNGELEELRRRQDLRWMWTLVEDQIRRAIHAHPAVRQVQGDLEREVLAGTLPATAASRRILEAFGIRTEGLPS
jgi:LAO/AO transport system kinase